jgi:hypothetical protein
MKLTRCHTLINHHIDHLKASVKED